MYIILNCFLQYVQYLGPFFLTYPPLSIVEYLGSFFCNRIIPGSQAEPSMSVIFFTATPNLSSLLAKEEDGIVPLQKLILLLCQFFNCCLVFFYCCVDFFCKTVSMLHQDEGGIRISIPDFQEIKSKDPTLKLGPGTIRSFERCGPICLTEKLIF